MPNDLSPLPLAGCAAKNFVFLGEAGCGKSELALNLSYRLAAAGKAVHLFDLDMTKPLFRSRDIKEAIAQRGVVFHFEEQFMDAPTLTGGVATLLRDPSVHTVLDVGGDYIGARSIGGYASLLDREDTAVCYIINPYRPWSGTIEHIDKVLGQTLGVSHIRLEKVHLAANPNLGPTTTPENVLEGLRLLDEMVSPYKPLDFLCAESGLAPALEGRSPLPVFPLDLQLTYPWDRDAEA